MKLETAKKYSDEIRNKVSELNQIIKSASQERVYVQLEIFEINNFGERYYPTVKAEIKISPTDLDD